MPLGKEINSIKSVTVINPERKEVLENYDINIEKGIITSIEPSNKAQPENSINGAGLFAIPGLIDTHVHSIGFLNEDIPGIFDLPWIFRQQRKNLAYYLKSGVTTIRDMGSALKLIRSYSRKAATFKIQSPRIVYAGPMFTIDKGYPHYVPEGPFFVRWFAGVIRVNVKDENHAVNMVDKAAETGARTIKVMYQSVEYDDDRTPIPIIPLPLLKVIVQRAHFHNIPVGIHHTMMKDLRNLLDSDIPFDSIEHITTDADLTENDLKQITQRKISISSTLSTYGLLYHIDELETLIEQEPERFEKIPIQFFKQVIEAGRSDKPIVSLMSRAYMEQAPKVMAKNLIRLFNAGVTLAYATDSGIMSPTGTPYWELQDMVDAGLSPLDALKSATNVAADVIRMPELGRLEERKIADIVLLHNNPLKDIKAIKNIAAVIRDGFLLHNAMK